MSNCLWTCYIVDVESHTDMSRPGGNPDFSKYQFSTERVESCTAKLSVRIQPSLLAKLQEQENWQDFVREAIASKLSQT